MGIIVDIVIIVIIALSILLGYKKGLIAALFKLISFFIAIIIAMVFYKPLSNHIINNTQIATDIKTAISQNLDVSALVQGDDAQIEESGVPQTMIDNITKNIQETAIAAGENVTEVLSENITITIINIGSALMLFIGTNILLMLLKFVIGLITKLPVIKQFDKLGGTLYGIIRGIFFVYLILAIISLVSPIIQSKELFSMINNSLIGSFMYNENIILKIIFKN